MSGDDDYEIPESGAVFTFGRSRFAENLPSHFFVRNDPVEEISCGDDHTALVCKSGRVFLFGRNDYGQLGFGHNKTINKPSCLKYLKPFHSLHIACGKAHTIVSTECNRLFSFGCNSDGQLGIGDLVDRTVPQMIPTDFLLDDNIIALAAGCHHSALLTEKGSAYIWGCNSDGQCGVEEDPYVPSPHKIEFDQPIITLSCGYYHTAFTSLGCVYTFGEGDNGKLGNTRKTSNYHPEKVDIEENCIRVICGGSHTMVLTENGTVYAFGSNFSGQLGIQNYEAETAIPTRVTFLEEETKIVKVSCGESHTAFLTDKGTLYTCGDSRYGKLCNDDDSTNFMVPTSSHLLKNYYCVSVSCGGCHTMVLAKLITTQNSTSTSFTNTADPLPPIKTTKEIEITRNETIENKEPDIDSHNEKQPQRDEEYDSKSNTESNMINEEVNSQLDEIYTEIEEIVTEKNEAVIDANPKFNNERLDSKDSGIVIAKKDNAIKKLLKVFQRKKSATAILVNQETETDGSKKIQTDNSSIIGTQNNSKTCNIL